MSLSSFHRTRSWGIEKLLSLKPGFSALFSLAHAEKTKKRFPSSLTRDAAQKAGREMTANHLGPVDQQSGLFIKLFLCLLFSPPSSHNPLYFYENTFHTDL